MNKTEELNRYKRHNSLRPMNKPLKATNAPRKNVQPIIHKNTKIDTNDLKYTDLPTKKSEHQIVCNNTIKKLPLAAYRLQRQTTINEFKRTQLENVADNKNIDGKNFQGVGLYEIKSYQLVEVSRKETEKCTAISNKSLDMCRKSAKQAAKFFHLAKVHKSKQISNPYMKFVDKVVKSPIETRKTAANKTKLPVLENGQLQEMMSFMGIEVSTQTEKTQTRFSMVKKNALLAFLLILLLSNILLLFALGLNINCKLNDPFPSLQFWQKLHGFFGGLTL